MALIYDTEDRHSAALCAVKEARGEGEAGMRAVLHILANRVDHPGFASTLHDVIYGKNQFSSMSIPTDREFNWEPRRPADVAALNYCLGVADAVLQAGMEDITKGAHYYCNPRTADSVWFSKYILSDPVNHPETIRLGNHIFYV